MKGLRYLMTGLFFNAVFAALVWSHPARGQVKQPPEVLEAYRVCEKFHHILGSDLDYGNAFEATFVREPARRRAIAIEGFDENGLQNVSDETVTKAAINLTRMFYLIVILGEPEEEERPLFFPPEIEQILDRKPPASSADFAAYAAQLEHDAALFRAHLERLAARYPAVAERVRKFREEEYRKAAILPPDTWVVEPQRSLAEWRGHRNNELYYEVGDCTVVREGEQMRIVHIRLSIDML